MARLNVILRRHDEGSVSGVVLPVGPSTAARSAWNNLVWFAHREPLGAVTAAIILVLVLCAAGAGVLAPFPYDAFDVTQRLLGPSSTHLFGTDEQGRDVLSRVLFGAQSSVLIGITVVAVATCLAVSVGSVSGYLGGWVDIGVQRFVDLWLSFPGLIFVILVVAIFGNNNVVFVVTLSLLLSAGSSRIIRSATIALRSQAFVEAARSLGAPQFRILVAHILPNLLPVIIVNGSIRMGEVVLLSATLSFLGFGPPPPFPSWGRMLQESQTQMQYHPNLAVFPGLAIVLTVYAFNMLGDALRDVLDPRLRRLH
jgi:peptide/nickel transport system permease protein